MLITLVLFATQLAANLSTASALSAAGHDAARRVAARTVDHRDAAAVARAEARATAGLRASLHGLGTVDDVRWSRRGGHLHLHVSVRVRRIAPRVLTRPVGLDRIERDVVVTLEQAR